MRDILFPFQETALAELHDKINKAHLMWSERDPQIISFSAPTGSGKTIIMTTLFEDILYGSADSIGEPDSVFIWLSDSPELNEQTRLKIESKSDKIRVRDLVTIESTFNTEYFEGGCIYFLEPHDPSRKDNYPKAVGLAKFAEKHWDKFGRIQLIRLKKGVDGRDHFYRLDMGKTTVRNKVRGIISNEELDRIFDTDAERED